MLLPRIDGHLCPSRMRVSDRSRNHPQCLKPQPQQPVVICGIGAVGLTAVMAAKYLGVQQVIAVDLVDERLKLAEELGATHIINSKHDPDLVKSIKALTHGGANFAVDCTGVVPVIEMMIECIGPRGVAATVGVPPQGKKIQIDPLTFLLENNTYVGVIEGDSVPRDVRARLQSSRPSHPDVVTVHSSAHGASPERLFPHRSFVQGLPCREAGSGFD